jgi:hypothetical protein
MEKKRRARCMSVHLRLGRARVITRKLESGERAQQLQMRASHSGLSVLQAVQTLRSGAVNPLLREMYPQLRSQLIRMRLERLAKCGELGAVRLQGCLCSARLPKPKNHQDGRHNGEQREA